MKFDPSKSLEELEGVRWGKPTYDSRLVGECHRLRKIPLCDFTAEDLRLMIGQEIGLRYLIPLALEKLRADPLISGDFYPGDLLRNVLMIETNFWRTYPQLAREAAALATEAFERVKVMDRHRDVTEEALLEGYAKFKPFAPT